jgi:polyisoprenoid-binding protein YceI
MSHRAGIGMAAIAGAAVLYVRMVNAAPIHLQIDPQKSQITASVADPLARFREYGRIEATLRIISGEVDGDPEHPGQTGHVKLLIDATSFNSGNNHRDNVVLAEALDTRDYQTIGFESTRLKNVRLDVPGKMGHAIVVGNLTMHGITRRVEVPADVFLDSNGTLGSDGEVSINYADFGVPVPRLLFALPAGREVTVHFHVIARPASTSDQPIYKR